MDFGYQINPRLTPSLPLRPPCRRRKFSTSRTSDFLSTSDRSSDATRPPHLRLLLRFWRRGAAPLRAAAARTRPPRYRRHLPIGATQRIDGVAARIEDDIITESEVQELAAFQKLVDGNPNRAGTLRELIDQWMVRSEATAAKYAQPSAEDVDRAYAEFVKQFPSPEEFKSAALLPV